jgi:hypothetical protein
MSKTLKASRTAVLVCQGRAAADGLVAPGRFADPTAMPLLRPDEREAVEWVRDGAPPRQWRRLVAGLGTPVPPPQFTPPQLRDDR